MALPARQFSMNCVEVFFSHSPSQDGPTTSSQIRHFSIAKMVNFMKLLDSLPTVVIGKFSKCIGIRQIIMGRWLISGKMSMTLGLKFCSGDRSFFPEKYHYTSGSTINSCPKVLGLGNRLRPFPDTPDWPEWPKFVVILASESEIKWPK